LTREELDGLLRFRLAQYLQIGFVDREVVCAEHLSAEPPEAVAPGDVHLIAGDSVTGEILCYAVIEQPPPAPAGCRMRSQDRVLFPVEKVHGAGVYDRLPVLPDLPVARIREMGRFVRSQRPQAGRDLLARAVVEVCVAMFRLMAGPLRMGVDAVIGDLEEHVAKQNLDFMHVPSVVIHGTVPFLAAASYLSPRYALHTVYPFACLTSDISAALDRLGAIEEALARPGRDGLLALLQLRSDKNIAESTLRPAGPDPAAGLQLSQPQVGMRQRARLLELGARLRRVPAFSALSAAEAATLSAHLNPVRIPAGHAIARQGQAADAIYIIERGEAAVDLVDRVGGAHRIGSLRAGQWCGHAALLDDGEHPATVTAITDMALLRLSKAVHDTYLTSLPDISRQLGKDALQFLVQIDHRYRHDIPADTAGTRSCGCGPECACTGPAPLNDPGAPAPNSYPSER
jgi:hypothetical protein